MKIKHLVWTSALGIFLTACSNDDDTVIPLPQGDYVNGVLVSNEGPFNNGTGTVSFISGDLSTVENGIYNTVNNEDLGNIVQSIGFEGDRAFIIANVSNTLTVVDRYTFEKIDVVSEGLNNPRYFVAVNGKGYVTNWGDPSDDTDDFVAVVNLDTYTVESEIPVDFGPEELVANSSTLYVAHQGGYGQNNKISVISAQSNSVSTTIAVGDVPNALQLDASGNLWVLSGGKPSYTGEETAGVLTKINTANNTVASHWEFAVAEHPNHLAIDGNRLYYGLNGAVYSLLTSANELPGQSEIEGLSLYAMTVANGLLYTTDAKDFNSKGSLNVHNLSTKALLKTFEVGIIPGGIYFNE